MIYNTTVNKVTCYKIVSQIIVSLDTLLKRKYQNSAVNKLTQNIYYYIGCSDYSFNKVVQNTVVNNVT